MNARSLTSKLLKFILQLAFALYESETELLSSLVAEVRAEGLTGDEARREVLRRFRAKCGGELRDSLVNFLIEAAVLSAKQ
jgi:hypothetical protein